MTDIMTQIGFHAYDASNIMPLQFAKEHPTTICGIMIDSATGATISPTFQQHYKFHVSEKFAEKFGIYDVAKLCLLRHYQISKEFFEGEAEERKFGLLTFNNEQETSLRVWTTKKVGKNIVWEATLSGYKGAVPEPKH
jgi:hypothetical protein